MFAVIITSKTVEYTTRIEIFDLIIMLVQGLLIIFKQKTPAKAPGSLVMRFKAHYFGLLHRDADLDPGEIFYQNMGSMPTQYRETFM